MIQISYVLYFKKHSTNVKFPTTHHFPTIKMNRNNFPDFQPNFSIKHEFD